MRCLGALGLLSVLGRPAHGQQGSDSVYFVKVHQSALGWTQKVGPFSNRAAADSFADVFAHTRCGRFDLTSGEVWCASFAFEGTFKVEAGLKDGKP